MSRDEILLNTAIHTLQTDEPDAEQVTASAHRVAGRLGVDTFNLASAEAGTSRNDVRHAWLKAEAEPKRVDWSAPKPRRLVAWRPQTFGLAFASTFAIAVASLFLYKAYWQVPPGVRAEVQSINGTAYRISSNGDRPLMPGETLGEGDMLRTSGGGHAVLRLTDGSTVEVNERSVVGIGARGHNMTVALENGALIVQAASRTSGHLYVKTADCRVAVTGTVFSVNTGLKGSRVAVLEGTVHVMHDGVDTLATAGNQVTTNANLGTEPVVEQIAWSHDRDKYLVLLGQFSTLSKQIAQIPFPQPRFTSDLLSRVPANTSLYISVPHLGDFLNQANQTFHEQLKQSPALQQWWNSGGARTSMHNSTDANSASVASADRNTEDLDALVDKIHTASKYLGDEILIVRSTQPVSTQFATTQTASGATKNSGFAVIADLKQPGLDEFLKQQLPMVNGKPGITVLAQESLKTAGGSAEEEHAGYALVRDHEVVFSNSVSTLAVINAQLNAGSSGFATTGFGKQITAAYGRGAGIILAADLHQMINNKAVELRASGSVAGHGSQALAKSGIESVSYLIAEHREFNGQPQNRVNLQFSGVRQGIASWLAAPGPIGSLNFVTPNAAIAVAALSKDPKSIADDLIAMASPNAENDLNEAEQQLQVNFRDQIAANLGGDFLVSLDGPVLPTPSWKAVIQVNDSAALESALEQLTQSIRQLSQEKVPHAITIVPSTDGGQVYYSVVDTVPGTTLALYTYADGYMIVAPSKALIIQAMQAYSSGNSLANSAAFKALLPQDANVNYSAVAYQNLSPVLTPLLTQVSGETAAAISKLAADAKPTAICARGEDNSIQASSDSSMFGFDFLTLTRLMHAGNNHANANVPD